MPKLIALLGLASAVAVLAPVVYADTAASTTPPTSNQGSTTILAAPVPADPAVRAIIQQNNDDLAAAEKSAVFTDYKKELMKITNSDFDFTDLGHAAYNRELFLKGEQGVMADTTAVTTDTWKVDDATKSTVDNSIDVTVKREQDATDHDVQGYFGAKGLTHLMTSNGTVWEHWIKSADGSWVMDDMALKSVKMTVDGKPYVPIAPKAPAAKKAAPKPKIEYRGRAPRVYTGGNNDVF